MTLNPDIESLARELRQMFGLSEDCTADDVREAIDRWADMDDRVIEELPAADGDAFGDLFALPLKDARDAFERAYLEAVLREIGSMSKAAERSGLERTHLYRKIKQLGINLPTGSGRQARRIRNGLCGALTLNTGSSGLPTRSSMNQKLVVLTGADSTNQRVRTRK